VKTLARIVALPLALVCGSTGALGLLLHYGSDTAAADRTRRLLQDATRSALDRGIGVPLDLAISAEELLSGTVLRFVLVPLALVALAFAVGLLGGGGGKSKEEASENADPTGESKTGFDKKHGRRIFKQAKALKKQGKFSEAGELLWTHELLDEAAQMFIAGGELVRAAELRHDQNRFLESAELHLEGENYESAGSIFGQQGEWARSAECYLKAGLKSVAAEMFEKAENHRQAAECYRETDFMRHAAANYVKCKAWRSAAECLEIVFREEGTKVATDPKKLADMAKLVRQAGKLFLKSQEPEKALEIFEKGGCHIEAADVATQLGDHEKAAVEYRAGGDVEKAAEALRQAGEPQQASRLLGQHLRDIGEAANAAAALEEAEDFMEAGDLYRNLENFLQAGVCYERQAGFAQAAEMFQLAGERERAATAYERAGQFTEAAECYALAGLATREAELLEKAGDFLRAGETYAREGLEDEAISVLQRVPEGDEDFSRAAAALGGIFADRDQLTIAITKLQQAIGGAELSKANIDSYYRLATIYQKDEKIREAADIYEKVLAIDYHHDEASSRLEECRVLLPENESVSDEDEIGPGATGGANGFAGSGGDDRYRIISEVGRGGMGIVYKVQDTVLDRVVAFKVLPQTLVENEQAIANFMREAQAAAKLNHPNIVTVYDTGERQGRYYIAMEYVEGTTLKEILRRRGAITPSGILHILMQISEALAYAHEKKVVHRDIKPANAMWTQDKKVKLMDFGLARVVEDARNHTTVVAGTPYYMSPEQTLGKNVDHRTDIYSLGVSLFEMATGTVPFKEGNIPYHHVHSPPPKILELRPELPSTLAAIIERCLEKDPANRFQSAKEILAEVRASIVSTTQPGA
jgi:tetratricopeptide (TPR) repeat protein/predicted Ser/Thr protein kinase